MSLKPYFILMRPANIITAIADILAGISVAGLLTQGFSPAMGALVLATIGLYGGGVVYNDIFDIELDRIERPERPLPSGQVSLTQAHLLGSGLLLMGILAGFWVSIPSGVIAIIIAVLALNYDKFAKHHQIFGPLNMGLCRSFNLLLGISISLSSLSTFWYLAIIPLIFIADITLTSQGEVEGKNKKALFTALFLDFVVVGCFVFFHFTSSYNLLHALPFLALWLWMNSSAKIKAIQDNQPKKVMNAVKMGVLSLIPLNASLAAGFENWMIGVIILSLLPISYGVAKFFSVT
jgi:4-hydroxybenzoate polyprenyltransferase